MIGIILRIEIIGKCFSNFNDLDYLKQKDINLKERCFKILQIQYK